MRLPLYGGETILRDGRPVSLATSAGFGHSVGQTIVFGYLDTTETAEDFEIEVFGARHPVRRVPGPLYDPRNERLKG